MSEPYKALGVDGEWEIHFHFRKKMGGTYPTIMRGHMDEQEADQVVQALREREAMEDLYEATRDLEFTIAMGSPDSVSVDASSMHRLYEARCRIEAMRRQKERQREENNG